MLPKLFFFLKTIGVVFSLAFYRLKLRIQASIHRWTYRAVADPKNVVIVGGSFAGFFLAKTLAESLPTGFRTIVVEKHSHFHFTWNFPRISVISGHTQNAFIPYPTKLSLAPDGIYSFQQGEVVKIEASRVILADGSSIPFEYLVIATGSKARYPAKLDAIGKRQCIRFFEERQARIKGADSIVIVGGGAAGVELAGDTKSKYPQKKVALVHSRKQLLNSFGPGLHDIAKNALEGLGVELCLGERVIAGLDSEESTKIVLQSGKTLQYDALVNSRQWAKAMACSDGTTVSMHRTKAVLGLGQRGLSLLSVTQWLHPCRTDFSSQGRPSECIRVRRRYRPDRSKAGPPSCHARAVSCGEHRSGNQGPVTQDVHAWRNGQFN